MISRPFVSFWIIVVLGCSVFLGCKGKGSKGNSDSSESEDTSGVDLLKSSKLRESRNNLAQIALCFHSYHDVNPDGLPQNIVDQNGKPLLSWRVLLLPIIEQQNLYGQFKLDEPWDSKNNIKLLEKMPNIYLSPRATEAKKGYTVYQGFAGKGALFQGGRIGFADIKDGLSDTIAVVEASTSVPWTKPEDLPFDASKEVVDFGKAYGDKPLVALLDASVMVLDLRKIKPATLKAAITIAGGEKLGKDWNR